MRIRSTRAATLVCAACVMAGNASAQTIEEIAAKNAEAKGGASRLKAIKAMRMTGNVSRGGVDVPMMLTTERPNKLRQESSRDGQKMVTAFDGAKAWTINPMTGEAAEVTGPPLDAMRNSSDFDGPLLDYAQKGITLELEGQETVDGAKAHKIKITRKDGQVQHLFLNADTGLEVKALNEVTAGGQTMTIESLFQDYKRVDGLMIPHRLIQKISGGPEPAQVTITIDKIEILPDVDDALFTMPAKKS
jgi:outer membrane lipoprotein-sorting protein